MGRKEVGILHIGQNEELGISRLFIVSDCYPQPCREPEPEMRVTGQVPSPLEIPCDQIEEPSLYDSGRRND